MASAKTSQSRARREWREPTIHYDDDAERFVLGAVLADAAMYPQLAPLPRASDFYRTAHRAIWEAVEAIVAEGGTPDEVTVIAWLKRRGRLGEAGGEERIAPLCTGVPPNYPYAAKGWATVLLEHAESRAKYDLGCAYTQSSQYPLDAAPRAEIARQAERLEDIQGRLRGEERVESSGKLLRFVSMAEVEVESIRWLWNGRLALGKITMVDGDPGLGKSLVTVDLAARVAMGQRMPDGSTGWAEPASVIFVSGEDSYTDTVAPRLLAAGVSPEAMGRIQGLDLVEEPRSDGATTERMFSLVTDLPQLEEMITLIGARLLVIDPITAYLGSGTDMYKDADLRRVLTPLAKMAERTGVAVVAVRHLNKSTGTPALHRGLGGVGFIGVARLGLLVAPNPDIEGEVLVSRHKGNIGAPPPTLAYRIVQMGEAENMPRVSWVGERETTAGDALAALVGGGVDRETRTATDEAVEWLRSYLADGPHPAKEVQDAAKTDKITERPLRKAKDRLKVDAYREGGIAGQGRWMWYYGGPSPESGRLRQHESTQQATNPYINDAPTKMTFADNGGHLSSQTTTKMTPRPERGHLSAMPAFKGADEAADVVISPKMTPTSAQDEIDEKPETRQGLCPRCGVSDFRDYGNGLRCRTCFGLVGI